ncbi:hypothetical protein EVAR_59522_1 [Eumeta japonica]|uniref:Uncharacterized protein n=1 Tax=Eumeta variegata TaxID=151549 RepID=A0A4C1XXD4_EUMVA|nr:hypothetical protein EVAR_59522_1 [Eumeta japonica]
MLEICTKIGMTSQTGRRDPAPALKRRIVVSMRAAAGESIQIIRYRGRKTNRERRRFEYVDIAPSRLRYLYKINDANLPNDVVKGNFTINADRSPAPPAPRPRARLLVIVWNTVLRRFLPSSEQAA